MQKDFRIESDSMGEMRVPADAYYGAQTARAVENFPVSNLRFPRSFIRALGLIKAALNTASCLPVSWMPAMPTPHATPTDAP